MVLVVLVIASWPIEIDQLGSKPEPTDRDESAEVLNPDDPLVFEDTGGD